MKRFVVFSAVLLLLVGLADRGLAQMSDQPGTLDRLRAEGGAFIIGYRTDAAPFSFAEGAEIKGYSVELCRRIADAVTERVNADTAQDVGVGYAPVTAANRFQMLREGAVDIVCGPTTLTLARQNEFDFSYLTFLTQAVLIAKKDRQVAGPFGEKVGAIANSTSLALLQNALASANAQDADLVQFASHDDGLSALRSGAIDSYFADRSILVGYAQADDTLTIIPGLTPIEQYALPMRGGDRELRLVANRVLAELYRSNEIDPIFQEAFPGARMADSMVFLYKTFSILDGEPLQ